MRSYEAARSLFSILSALSWGLIVVGAIVALLGGKGTAEMMGSAAFVLGTIPGIMLALAGFFGLVFAQIGRAGVDSAEYGQQMLQVSRDQLEVSKQTLRQGEAVKNSFEALNAAKVAEHSASFASLRDQSADAPSKGDANPPKVIEYKGKEVVALENGFRFSGMEFGTLDAAKSYIDQLGVNPNAGLTSPA